MRIRRAGVVAIWLVAAIAAVIVLVAVEPDARLGALALTLAGSVVLSFVVQLSVPEKRGFVTRLMASTVGAFAVTLVASLIALATA